MSIIPIANMLTTWKRATSYVLDPVSAGDEHTPDRPYTGASAVQVRVYDGASVTGYVVVTGNTPQANGDTETLTFDGNGFQVTSKLFDYVSEVDSSGIEWVKTRPTIEAKAIARDGSPYPILYALKGPGFPIAYDPRGGATERIWTAHRPEAMEADTVRFLVQYEDTWLPRQGDRIQDDRTGDVYEVQSVTEERAMYTSHWRIMAKRVARPIE